MQPKSIDPAFIGHVVKHDFQKYTIHRETANYRGGTSWDLETGCRVAIANYTTVEEAPLVVYYLLGQSVL
jgi:hypothetical protein